MTSSIDATAASEPHGVALSDGEIACLRCIAGHMIPASAEFGLPGADDPSVVASILETVERDAPALTALLGAVDAAAGGSLAALPAAAQAELLARLRADATLDFRLVESVVSRGYYRDVRVLASIGMETRAPFPKGYDVPQGDWSLLDPVRRAGQRYRPA